MTTFIKCYNQKTRQMELFEVPRDVYTYILQLEAKVTYPELTGINELYPDRFHRKELGVDITVDRQFKQEYPD